VHTDQSDAKEACNILDKRVRSLYSMKSVLYNIYRNMTVYQLTWDNIPEELNLYDSIHHRAAYTSFWITQPKSRNQNKLTLQRGGI
jgi:hypothetical protein